MENIKMLNSHKIEMDLIKKELEIKTKNLNQITIKGNKLILNDFGDYVLFDTEKEAHQEFKNKFDLNLRLLEEITEKYNLKAKELNETYNFIKANFEELTPIQLRKVYDLISDKNKRFVLDNENWNYRDIIEFKKTSKPYLNLQYQIIKDKLIL